MYYELTVTQFTRMLHNLKRILSQADRHAEAKKFDVEVLLQARLAPDQFNLIRQVQITTDVAKLCVARLTTKEAPIHEDAEKTLAELQQRIDDVIGYLASVSTNDFAGAGDRQISQARWEGKYLTGLEFLNYHALPNFYFHLTTTYAILRHNGVDVGKKDYLGELPFKK